ncbi:nucleoside phosphatase GDA1/CD39, partial [Conidiobolus coronatus NRRL 28638]
KELVQYAIIIDAGSTGSRVHVYKFNNCVDTPEVEDEVFVQNQPGLSFYKDDPKQAAGSLKELLDIAVKSVPKNLHSCTPITVKATAGLRLLKDNKDKLILEAVHQLLDESYPFLVVDNGVEVMDGKDEGIFAWITVNYLLNKLDRDSNPEETVATLDLGGGSTQIVLEPNFLQEYSMHEDYAYKQQFSGHEHTLYQHSYLKYGLMSARQQVKLLATKDQTNTELNHPCLAPQYKDDSIEGYTLVGNSNFDECLALVNEIFPSTDCIFDTCSFNGVYHPNLKATFEKNDIYAFSYFYDRTQPFGLGADFTLSDIRQLATKICSNDIDYFKSIEGAEQELKENPNRCLDLTYIYSLLSVGYGLEDSRVIKTAKKVKGFETGWCLGAAISIL